MFLSGLVFCNLYHRLVMPWFVFYHPQLSPLLLLMEFSLEIHQQDAFLGVAQSLNTLITRRLLFLFQPLVNIPRNKFLALCQLLFYFISGLNIAFNF